jgi:cell division protein FtsI (penicillin-binding protein 3)
VHKNLKEVIEKISKLIDFKNAEEKTNFLNKESLIDPNLKYFILKKNLTQDERDRILGLKISGVYFEKEIKRFYPEGDLASSILGFVASSKEESQKG